MSTDLMAQKRVGKETTTTTNKEEEEISIFQTSTLCNLILLPI